MDFGWPPLSERSMHDAVADRRAALAAQSFHQLAALPAIAASSAFIEQRPAELWTYIDRVAADRVRVVVQLTARPAPMIASNQVHADGFWRGADGSTEPMDASALGEFFPRRDRTASGA